MMTYFDGFGGMTVLAWTGMLLFWGGLIVLAVWAIRSVVPHDRRSDREVTRDVLQQRYAVGEISDAEYQQAIKTLG